MNTKDLGIVAYEASFNAMRAFTDARDAAPQTKFGTVNTQRYSPKGWLVRRITYTMRATYRLSLVIGGGRSRTTALANSLLTPSST